MTCAIWTEASIIVVCMISFQYMMMVFYYTWLLSILLVTKADEYREQELLYASVGKAEYIFGTKDNDIDTLRRAMELRLTERKEFAGTRRDEKSKKTQLTWAYSFTPFNSRMGFSPSHDEVRILRLEDGETTEYTSQRNASNSCFEDVRLASQSSVYNTTVTEPVSLEVQEELNDICEGGFSALKPSAQFPTLNGLYAGNRNEVNVKIKFVEGKVKDLDLVAQQTSLTHQPLCSGVISMLVGPPVTIILEKRKRSGVIFQRMKPSGHPLCSPEHIRRHLTWAELETKWDKDLPDDFKIHTLTSK